MAVAHRMYARALFQAAREQGRLEEVASELRELAAAIDRHAAAPRLPPEPADRPAGEGNRARAADRGRQRPHPQLRPARGREGPRRRARRHERGARRARREGAEPARSRADDRARALGRRGALDRRAHRAGVGPHRRGDALGRPLARRRHRPPDRLVPRGRQRPRPARAPPPRTDQPRIKEHQ